MLRVTTGTAKNKRLKIPEIEGFRGVQEKAKLALFSILGDKIKDTVCLDLFAGSGNLGIEALSRGAEWCDFVDENSVCTNAIEKNLHNCGFLASSEVFRKSAVKYVSGCEKHYNVIFMDPFYADTAQTHLFKLLPNILSDDGMICFFHDKSVIIATLGSKSLTLVSERRFGNSFLSILKK